MLIKLAWRNLWRNKLRTSIMLGAMVFGLMGVVAMIGFMNGLVDSMIKMRLLGKPAICRFIKVRISLILN